MGRPANSLGALGLFSLLPIPTSAYCLGMGSNPTSTPRVIAHFQASGWGTLMTVAPSVGIAPGSHPVLQDIHQLSTRCLSPGSSEGDG